MAVLPHFLTISKKIAWLATMVKCKYKYTKYNQFLLKLLFKFG
jgi:hypothetical protein